LKWEVGPVVVPKEWDFAAAMMRPPASPSCRLALRAGSHRGKVLRPGGKRKYRSWEVEKDSGALRLRSTSFEERFALGASWRL
jgi:hypothetical protein